ncbi:MAG TPA: EF-hand domain-containing protein [Phycisphaerales bacterium]|nr:EF-hand domain-containing protein [Phycisphaerales bacterium]
MSRRNTSVALLAASIAAPAAMAQSNVEAAHKFTWSENIGFMNWRDANSANSGVAVNDSLGYLAGSIWCENVGWISLGAGNGPYANTNGTNYGVNVNTSTGALTGYAWGENIGWVNFRGGALATPAQPARFDFNDRRFYGYAWGENIGWINLNNATVYVAAGCRSDFDGTGFVDTDDFTAFVLAFEQGDERCDIDGTGFVDTDDFTAFVLSFEFGC